MNLLRFRSLLYRSGLSFLGVFPIPVTILRQVIRMCLAIVAGKNPKASMKAYLLIKDDLIAMINRTAILYDEGTHVKHRLMKYHDFFVQRIRTGERVFDIGCGDGALSFDLAKHAGAFVTGIDIEEKKLNAARMKYHHPRLRFLKGDVTKIALQDDFDVVVLSNVLEHIQDRITFIKRINNTIKPARYLLRVPMIDRDWHVPLRKELGLPYFSDATHFTEYSEQSFLQELKASGLNLNYYQINWGEIWAEANLK